MVAKLVQEHIEAIAENAEGFKQTLLDDISSFVRDEVGNIARVLHSGQLERSDKEAIERYIKITDDFLTRQSMVVHCSRGRYWKQSEEQKQIYHIYLRLQRCKLDYLLDEVIPHKDIILNSNNSIQPDLRDQLRNKNWVIERLYSWLCNVRILGQPYLSLGYRPSAISDFFKIKDCIGANYG